MSKHYAAKLLAVLMVLTMVTIVAAQRQWPAQLPSPGQQAPDFTLQTPDGHSVTLSDLYKDKPVVLEFGCISCPVSQGKINQMARLQREVGDRAHFLLVYTLEAHPADVNSPYAARIWIPRNNEEIGLVVNQPTTYAERVALAQQVRDQGGVTLPLVVDGMDNAVWEAYGRRPNSGFLIEQGGRIALAQNWIQPFALAQYFRRGGWLEETGELVNVRIERDLEYGVVEGISLKLDAYLPTGEGLHPAMLLIHGGGWRGGDKRPQGASGLNFARQGVAAFAINYRLSGQAPYPAAVDDCVRAVRWIRENAAAYNLDPDRLAAMGGSAGGHLSLMLATLEPGEEDRGAQGNPLENWLVCAVATAGPTDLMPMLPFTRSPAVLEAFMGGTPEEVPDNYVQASPVTHVSADDPPLLLLHGIEDVVVPYQQALTMQARCQEVGVPVELITVPGGGHGLRGGAPQLIRQALERKQQFILEHLLPTEEQR